MSYAEFLEELSKHVTGYENFLCNHLKGKYMCSELLVLNYPGYAAKLQKIIEEKLRNDALSWNETIVDTLEVLRKDRLTNFTPADRRAWLFQLAREERESE